MSASNMKYEKCQIFHLIYFEKIWISYDKYFEEIFTNYEKILWKKGLYKFLMKLLSKSSENFGKMLRKFKKTLHYSLIWEKKSCRT